MTKDELEKEATLCVQAYLIGAEMREKSIKELEKRISILLYCKNCPDNKGGFICQKEYEDKCLAQKIQYIEELKEENAELTDELKHFLALWENTVCEIREENKTHENNAHIAHLCDKLESSMIAYAKGDVEYAHFVI